eukprot:4912965-Pyramimonas_sp.AAC.1
MRKIRETEPMPIATKHGDPFCFPKKWQDWRGKITRVHQQLANNDASDLEHEVWKLWLDCEPAPAYEDGH